MTIEDQMITIANELAEKYGNRHVVELREIYKIFKDQYGTKEGSIIPSDYCYNRINNGIQLKKATVFEYLGNGRYRCLGLNFPYNGTIFHKPTGQSREFAVGKCINGERIIAPDSEYDDQISGTDNSGFKNTDNPRSFHRTKRDPSMGLRFEVLKRDNFKCCACGASPAKDPAVELHIDHILPWSKGGETDIGNLQTLCSVCNLGKSDVH